METKRNFPVFRFLLIAVLLSCLFYSVFIYESPQQKMERNWQENSAKADAARAEYRKSRADKQWMRWMQQRGFAGTLKNTDILIASHSGQIKPEDFRRLKYRTLTPQDVGKLFHTQICPAAEDRGGMLALIQFLDKGEERRYQPFADGEIEDLASGQLVTLRGLDGDVAKVELKDSRVRFVPYWGVR